MEGKRRKERKEKERGRKWSPGPHLSEREKKERRFI